ncbi:VWA domain-containing protein [Methanobacterium movens]
MEDVARLSSNLRKKGIPVSIRSTHNAFLVSEFFSDIKTAETYKYLKEALSAVYVKNKDQLKEFNQAFDATFKAKDDSKIIKLKNSTSKPKKNNAGKKFSNYKMEQDSSNFKMDSKIKLSSINEDKINFNPPLADYEGIDLRENSLMERDINELDFFEAELFELCQKLGRKIANKRARRNKRSKTNRIDIRRSIRKNLKYGGVLIELEKRKPYLKKNQHFFLSDVSGSCDWISNWFFCMVYAAQKSFNQSRFFDFDNKSVETTRALSEKNLMEGFTRVREIRQKNIMMHGTSNMYTAFNSFIKQANLNHKSIVLILTDCRDWAGPKKFKKPLSADLMEHMCRISKKVIILNPEPKIKWNVVDSCVSDYEDAGAQIMEVRNLKQLARLVEHI